VPEIYIYAYEGRSIETKRKLMQAVTQAICESLDVKPEVVTIQLIEGKRENRAVGWVLATDAM
jgi:4-oxalocrotonate tautomerase